MVESGASGPAGGALATGEEVLLLSRRLGEPPAAVDFRLSGLEACRLSPLPDRAGRLWRYTDPAALLPRGPDHGEGAPAAAAAGGGPAVLLRPGAPPAVRLDEEARRAGVAVLPLAAAGPDLGRLVPPAAGLFAAFNAALWSAGALVRIPAGAVLAAPLRVVVPAGRKTAVPRLLVQVGPGAAAVVVEEHLGGSEGFSVHGVTEIVLAPGADLAHIFLARWAPGVRAFQAVRGEVAAGAHLVLGAALLGGGTVKLEAGAVLAGPGALSEVAAVACADGRQHLDLHTEHRHEAPRTTSEMQVRAAVAGRARLACTGLIRIGQGSPGCAAYQEARSLLLSPRARVDAIPELEILTDDVRCTHGATVSPVPADQLFYLESRGQAPAEARRLLVAAFLAGPLARLPAAVRGEVEALAAAKAAAAVRSRP